jgi:ferritin-like metal-binding protein YciE
MAGGGVLWHPPGMKNKNSSGQGRSAENEAGEPMNAELHQLFREELADVMNAEMQLTKALVKMAKAAESEELEEAFTSHQEETENHVQRLKEVFESLNEKAKSKTCKAMKGLVEEASGLMKELKGSSASDAGLIAAAQKVEHYEIAAYGSLRAWAEEMGHKEAVRLLDETLEEEKAADEKLTEIAESLANAQPA